VSGNVTLAGERIVRDFTNGDPTLWAGSFPVGTSGGFGFRLIITGCGHSR
jgi:hypothetical protein